MSLYDESAPTFTEAQLVEDNLARLSRSIDSIPRVSQGGTMMTYRIGEPRPEGAIIPVLPATHDLDKLKNRDIRWRDACQAHLDEQHKRAAQPGHSGEYRFTLKRKYWSPPKHTAIKAVPARR